MRGSTLATEKIDKRKAAEAGIALQSILLDAAQEEMDTNMTELAEL